MWAYSVTQGTSTYSATPAQASQFPLQDVRTLTLTSNPARETEASINANAERAQFICPLSLKEMNGAQPFVYLSTCGCVFSQAGLANVSRSTPPSADSEKSEQLDLCPHCSQKYSRTSDIIILNPSVEEEEKLREAMVQKRLTEPVKKSKKRKAAAAASAEELEHPKKKAAPTPTIRTARKQVLESLAEEEAKRKASMSDAVKALYASSDGNKKKETFMTMGTFTRVRNLSHL